LFYGGFEDPRYRIITPQGHVWTNVQVPGSAQPNTCTARRWYGFEHAKIQFEEGPHRHNDEITKLPQGEEVTLVRVLDAAVTSLLNEDDAVRVSVDNLQAETYVAKDVLRRLDTVCQSRQRDYPNGSITIPLLLEYVNHVHARYEHEELELLEVLVRLIKDLAYVMYELSYEVSIMYNVGGNARSVTRYPVTVDGRLAYADVHKSRNKRGTVHYVAYLRFLDDGEDVVVRFEVTGGTECPSYDKMGVAESNINIDVEVGGRQVFNRRSALWGPQTPLKGRVVDGVRLMDYMRNVLVQIAAVKPQLSTF